MTAKGPKRCTDCKGSTPHAWWRRCEECALRRLRAALGGRALAPPPVRRYVVGDRVRFKGKLGRVARIGGTMDAKLVVDFDEGGRDYAELREIEPATSAAEGE